MVMVFRADQPNRGEPARGSVEVINGGYGRFLISAVLTPETRYFAFSKSPRTVSACSLFLTSALSSPILTSCAVKSFRCLLFAVCCLLVRKSAPISQYSTGTNAPISRSRSTISRTAIDWTRPAESQFFPVLYQSNGDSL